MATSRRLVSEAGLGSLISASAAAVRGTRVALGGDSITDGAGATNVTVDSWRAYLPKILGTARCTVLEHGVPGETAAGLLARMPAILAENPDVFVMMIGMNPSSSLASYKREVTAILDAARFAGVPTLVSLITPRREDVAHQERINVYNLWLRHIAITRALPVADPFSPMVDPATGYARATLMNDATHPNPLGHLEIAKAIANSLDLILPPISPLVTAVGAPGLLANPLMLDGTTWSLSAGLPTGAAGAVSIADPEPGDGLPAGKWLKMSVDATGATSTSNYVRHQNFTATPAAGDLLLITAQVKTSTERPGAMSVLFNDGTTMKSVIGDGFGVTHPGTIRRIYTAPAFTSTPNIRVSVSALAGKTATGYIGAVQVFNLTQLGLTEIV